MPSCSIDADRHAVVGEHARHGVQHAGRSATSRPSRYSADVSSIGRIVRVGERAERPVRARAQVDGGVDEVAEHGARRSARRRRRGRRT